MLRHSSSPLAFRLAIRWQEAAWPVAVVIAPAVRARVNVDCRSARRPGVRPLLRNPYPKRLNP